jgi:plasmid stabilization system protein ParE
MKLTWGRRARLDLNELIAYIAEDSPQTAELVADRILTTAELLTQMPRSGRIGRVAGTRERVVGRTPYILAYRIKPGRIQILRVYRGARKWPKYFQ